MGESEQVSLYHLALFESGTLFKEVCSYLEDHELVHNVYFVGMCFSSALHGLPIRLDQVFNGPLPISALNSRKAWPFIVRWRIIGLDVDFNGKQLNSLCRIPALDVKQIEYLNVCNVGISQPQSVHQFTYALDSFTNVQDISLGFTGELPDDEEECISLVVSLQDRFSRYRTFGTDLLSLRGYHHRLVKKVWICSLYEKRYDKSCVLSGLHSVLPTDPDRFLLQSELGGGDSQSVHGDSPHHEQDKGFLGEDAMDQTTLLNAIFELALLHGGRERGDMDALLCGIQLALSYHKFDFMEIVEHNPPVFKRYIPEESMSRKGSTKRLTKTETGMLVHEEDLACPVKQNPPGKENNPKSQKKKKKKKRELAVKISDPANGHTEGHTTDEEEMKQGRRRSSHSSTGQDLQNRPLFEIPLNTKASPHKRVLSPGSPATWPLVKHTKTRSARRKKSSFRLPSHLRRRTYTETLLSGLWETVRSRLGEEESCEEFLDDATTMASSIIMNHLFDPLVLILTEILGDRNSSSFAVRGMCRAIVEFVEKDQAFAVCFTNSNILMILINLLIPANDGPDGEQQSDGIIVLHSAFASCDALYALQAHAFKRQNITAILAGLCSRAERFLMGDEFVIEQQIEYLNSIGEYGRNGQLVGTEDVVVLAARVINASCELMCALLELDSVMEVPVISRQARTAALVLDIGKGRIIGPAEDVHEMSLFIADCAMYLYKEAPDDLEPMTDLMKFLFNIVPQLPPHCLFEAVEVGAKLASNNPVYVTSYIEMAENLVVDFPVDWTIYPQLVSKILSTLSLLIETEEQFQRAHHCAKFVLDDYYSHESYSLLEASLKALYTLFYRFIRRVSPECKEDIIERTRASFRELVKKLSQNLHPRQVDDIRGDIENVLGLCGLTL
eukprot:CAMPEP_0203746692 /NCGR_PEP_ID=MMETSP0098-20131031/2056_1 /ASSEMBLY_ACC=CAM_ASM_000208 /TAXON_ID=96639 /ORGANISM=" , Strain NY0313808BC1" /LENGTH=898 /DNA_ID=CAMNT_0050634881 /DNA_START=446 /DNA_END=3142 /DNA_ORIENTATION=+